MKDLLSKIRLNKPVVHCITNNVTINDCANVLVAVGASPIMAHHVAEVAEVATHASALVCNLGATYDYDSMLIAVKAANEAGVPVVLDPVGVAVSSYRRDQALKLINDYRISCIRGNYSEMTAIAKDHSTAAGLDNKLKENELDLDMLSSFAKVHGLKLLMSGTRDYVIDNDGQIVVCEDYECSRLSINGTSRTMMTSITGSGCMLTALAGAALAVNDSADSLRKICTYYRGCGDIATRKCAEIDAGSMTFKMLFIDEISKGL